MIQVHSAIVTVLLSAVFALAAGCSRGAGDSRGAAAAQPKEVRIARAEVLTIRGTFEAGGVIKARMTAQVSSRIPAEVREVRVQPGDRVRRGQVLAVMDDRDLSARRAQAEAALGAAKGAGESAAAARESADAALALARANYGRIEALHGRRSATPQELDRATAELRMAEVSARAGAARVTEASASVTAAASAHREAEVVAAFARIEAPFDGVVTNRLLEPGNMAAPGVPLVTVESLDEFRLEAQIDETRAAALKVGDAAPVLISGGDPIPGRIVEVARGSDASGHTFLVKIALPAGSAVRSGMFGRAHLPASPRRSVVAPVSAVVRRGQLAMVFVADAEGRARLRAVSTGAIEGERIEVLAGLREGESVVVDPPAALLDGAPVRSSGGRP